MKEKIYSILNPIAPTFYRSAPKDNGTFPLIIFYYILNEPLYKADNSYSKSRRIIVNVEVWDRKFVDDLAGQVEQAMKTNIKAVLRREEEIDDEAAYGIRYEFEIFNL